MAREYFHAYHSYLETMEPLNDAERGRLFTALLAYSRTGEAPELRGNERFVFPGLRSQIDRDSEAYAVKCQSRAENARKRWDANGCGSLQTDANHAKEKEKEKTKAKEKEELSGKPDPHPQERDVTQDRPGAKPPAKQARFAPPALEEVAGYCKERRNAVDAQRFVDYYTANGWKVGKNPMKDWRAAVRNWERGGFSQGKTQNGEALPADRVLAGGPSPAPKWGAR